MWDHPPVFDVDDVGDAKSFTFRDYVIQHEGVPVEVDGIPRPGVLADGGRHDVDAVRQSDAPNRLEVLLFVGKGNSGRVKQIADDERKTGEGTHLLLPAVGDPVSHHEFLAGVDQPIGVQRDGDRVSHEIEGGREAATVARRAGERRTIIRFVGGRGGG